MRQSVYFWSTTHLSHPYHAYKYHISVNNTQLKYTLAHIKYIVALFRIYVTLMLKIRTKDISSLFFFPPIFSSPGTTWDDDTQLYILSSLFYDSSLFTFSGHFNQEYMQIFFFNPVSQKPKCLLKRRSVLKQHNP